MTKKEIKSVLRIYERAAAKAIAANGQPDFNDLLAKSIKAAAYFDKALRQNSTIGKLMYEIEKSNKKQNTICKDPWSIDYRSNPDHLNSECG